MEADWTMQLPYLLRDGGYGAGRGRGYWRLELENNSYPVTVDGQS
jgi:hypothetical protein